MKKSLQNLHKFAASSSSICYVTRDVTCARAEIVTANFLARYFEEALQVFFFKILQVYATLLLNLFCVCGRL